MGRRKTILLRLTLSIGSLVMLMALIEGWAYLWERREAQGMYAWEMVASRRIDLVRYTDPAPGYTLIEPGQHYEWGGIPVEINSLGLRGPETTPDKPAGTFRILNLGDSIAMGWGVRFEETYGAVLQGALRTGEGLTAVEVINAGVPGWNLENELAYLENRGLALDPDLVILDLTLVNDIFGGNALNRNNRPALIEWLRAHTYFYPYLSIQMQWLQARSAGQDRIPVIDPPTEASKYFPTDPGSDRWDDFWGQIEAIHSLTDAQGLPLVLVLFPLEFQVVDPNYETTPQIVLLERAAAAGIPAVDLLPVFTQACLEKPGGTCTLEDRYLFADVWMHPSALGHRLTAETVLPVLEPLIEENN